MDQVAWFSTLLTQLIVSPAGGAIGINYLVAYRDMDDMEITGAERDEWKWKLRIMEREALHHLNKPAS